MRRVAKITKLSRLFGRWLAALVTWSAALAQPTGAKRKARRMQPTSVIQLAGWEKKWASHILWLLAILLSLNPHRQCKT